MLKTERWFQREILATVISPILFVALYSWIFKGDPFWQALLVGIGFFCVVGGWGTMSLIRKLRRAEQWRRLAFANPRMVPLAQPQPVADPAAIPLPTVIFSRPSWVAYPLTLIGIWAGFVVWLFLSGMFHAGSIVSPLLLAVAAALPLSVLALLSRYKWIEVSEEGLTLRDIISRRSVRWQEAELFAIAASVKGGSTSTEPTPIQFEISSATTIVRWTTELKPSRLTRLSSPFPEYARQMSDLLLLIAGKTGLPLHDLRGWQAASLPKKQKKPKPLSPIRRIIANLQR